MSTPAQINFIAGGVVKTAYVHWDGDSLGPDLVSWLRVVRDTDLAEAIKNLKVVSDFETPNTPASTPTQAETKRLAKYQDTCVGGPGEEWYRLLRGTQGDPGKILESGYLYDGSDTDAGYVYEINADKRLYTARRDGDGVGPQSREGTSTPFERL